MDFEKQVRQEIKDFSKEQVVAFAWRCAVRALPILGHKGHFDFWEEKDRQKYLYATFKALDVSVFYFNNSDSSNLSAAINARSVYLSAISASLSASSSSSASSVVSSVCSSASSAAFALSSVVSASSSSSYDVRTAAAAAARFAVLYKMLDLKILILDDIKAIKAAKNPILQIDIYGNVWTFFLKTLRDNDCSYWADWYEKLFQNNFEFDNEEVKQRFNIPDEIKDQGAAAVGHYIQLLKEEGGGKRLNEARILILGDKGAGKTCVARKLLDPNAAMTTPDESTPGVDTSTWKLTKENMNVSIWDFAGHTVTHAVHQFFLSERCLYILVYNGRTEDTSSLEYWLDHMKNYGGGSEAIILVNERDQHHNEIPINRLKEQYKIAGVYYLNVEKDKKKFKLFRKEIAEYIVNNPSWKNQEIPSSYYKVKEELEKCFAKNKNGKTQEQMTKEAFDAIAQKNGIEDSERLLQDLHALGVSLWYKGMEQYNTLILNPEWISDGVYQIINWVHNQKTHEIALSEFKEVFAEEKERYPKEQYNFLFDLILNYELAYKTDKGSKLIMPHLLKEDQPDHLPTFGIGDSLMLKYKADQALPPHTISRFIVKHSDQIKKKGNAYLVWRFGVILEDGNGNTALVREWDRAIDVSVKGPTKTEYISQFRETLNGIFDGYKSKRPELQYNITPFGDESHLIEHSRLPEHLGKPPENWLAEQTILSYLQRNRDYYDVVSNKDIPPKEIVNLFNIQVQGNQNFISKANAVSTGDHSNIQANTFNFKDCNITLQGSLNELAFELSENGEEEAAKELEIAAKALEEVENETKPEQVKKKGVWSRLKRTITNLNDPTSTLHQAVKLLKNGKALAKGIMDTYEKVSPWIEQIT
jgi:GTPase SAR1 family protein